jgi:hypothetical protein
MDDICAGVGALWFPNAHGVDEAELAEVVVEEPALMNEFEIKRLLPVLLPLFW